MENVIFDITKEKSNVKGFWQSTSGKIFVDNIRLYKPENAVQFEMKISELFDRGELAIFTIGREEAYILYPDYKVTLKQKIQYVENHLKASNIKALLKEHGGLTIERIGISQYRITIWKE